MSLSTKRDELRRACLAGNQEACGYIRDLTGFAEGGLMEDSSRLWRMESQYPEFQKGISSRVTKEQVPTTPVEEQFMYSPTQQGYNKGGVVPPGVLKRSPDAQYYINERTGEVIPGKGWMVNPRIPPGVLKRSPPDYHTFIDEKTGERLQRIIPIPSDSEKGYAEGGPVRSTDALLEAMDESPVRSTDALLEAMDESPVRNSEELFNYYDETGSMLAPEVPLDFQDGMPGDMPMEEGAGEVLTPEETEVFSQALSDYPELQPILTKLGSALVEESMGTSMEAPIEGAVEGPGTGTSDSIDAKLSDGEFVFTAKAVKQLGVDKLRKMMSKAEIDFDDSSDKQTFAQMSDEGFAAGGLINRPVYS